MNEQTKIRVQQNKPRAGLFRRYLFSVSATMLILLSAYVGSLAVLARAGVLPPPPLVNELCADRKLQWLRNNMPARPDLLVVGSSIAWRDVDSAEFVAHDPRARPVNGGMCHAEVNQSGFVTKFLLDHMPSVETVVLVLVPQDFTDCTKTPARLFSPAVATRYVFGHDWSYGFYLNRFAPVALVHNVREIHRLQDGVDRFDSMKMTRYGDGPLRITGNRGLMYGTVGGRDPACVAALHTLAISVAAKGRRLFVAMAPLNPDWVKQYDPSGARRANLLAAIHNALAGTGANFWNGTAAFKGTPNDFTDAIHINWPAAKRYSALMAKALDPDPS
ncbi:hypothetical protein [Lichenicoccus sp.]|uniref:hypothetical protein n=1 Tax=Lichenicoccus sp. TaxID=2781899 RepID=UPI003D130CB9